jgi:hypothetical protein
MPKEVRCKRLQTAEASGVLAPARRVADLGIANGRGPQPWAQRALEHDEGNAAAAGVTRSVGSALREIMSGRRKTPSVRGSRRAQEKAKRARKRAP